MDTSNNFSWVPFKTRTDEEGGSAWLSSGNAEEMGSDQRDTMGFWNPQYPQAHEFYNVMLCGRRPHWEGDI